MALTVKATCCPQVMLKEHHSDSFKDVDGVTYWHFSPWRTGLSRAQADKGTVLLVACRHPWEAHAEENLHVENAQTAIPGLGSFQLKTSIFFMKKPDKDLEASWEQMLQQCSAWKTHKYAWQCQALNGISHNLKSTIVGSK